MLTVAVLRIRRIVNEIKGIDIRIGRLVLHLTAFWLYFISFFIYYVCYHQKNTRSGPLFAFALLFTVVTETISVILLTYIIWEIYNISLEQQMLDEEYERLQSLGQMTSGNIDFDAPRSSINSPLNIDRPDSVDATTGSDSNGQRRNNM